MTEPLPFPSRGSQPGSSPDPATPSGTPSTDNRVYTNEEVSEIVRVALRNAKTRDANTVDHDELLAIAHDFGLSEEDIGSAFEEIGKSRAVDELNDRARLALKVHAMVFAVVNVGLLLINLMSDPTYLWFLFPLVSWGMALMLHAIATKYVPSLAVHLEHAFAYSRQFYGMRACGGRESARAKFTIPNLYGDLAEARGVARIRGDKLIIEFEVVDNVLGAFRSRIREISIPMEEIASVRLERNLWSTSLHIESYGMKRFRALPGSAGGQLKLVFNRDAQAASEELARELAERVPAER